MKIKFTKETVTGHLRMKHNLDINTYEAHYMYDFDWDQDPGKVTVTRRESVTSFDSLPGELVIAELDHGVETVPVNGVVKDKDPWNKCQFQCKLCDIIYTDRRNVKSHIVMSHKMSYQDYVGQYSDPELPTAKWQCAMCGSETRHARLWTKTKLRATVNQPHCSGTTMIMSQSTVSRNNVAAVTNLKYYIFNSTHSYLYV